MDTKWFRGIWAKHRQMVNLAQINILVSMDEMGSRADFYAVEL